MNDKRRKALRRADSLLERAYSIVEFALEQEQDCVDNIPESFQSTDMYERMENSIDNLESAADRINDAREKITEEFD